MKKIVFLVAEGRTPYVYPTPVDKIKRMYIVYIAYSFASFIILIV